MWIYSTYFGDGKMCYFALTSKMGRCWDMLELSPSRIPFIESSHKWTGIIFIIYNYKLGMWICSHPTIDVNSQSNFYDVLTLYHRRLYPELHLILIPENLKTTYSEHILHIVPSLHCCHRLHHIETNIGVGTTGTNTGSNTAGGSRVIGR